MRIANLLATALLCGTSVGLVAAPPSDIPLDRVFQGRFEPAPRGIILWIADDLGAISSDAYGDLYPGRSSAADMRVMRQVCSSGVRFTQAWSSPMCTPTRGSIMTGRYGFRTDLGGAQTDTGNQQPDINLIEASWSLPRLLALYGDPSLQLASYGKWHLGVGNAIGGNCAPYVFGWKHYAGKIKDSQLVDYEDWTANIAGPPVVPQTLCEQSEVHVAAGIGRPAYATAYNVDDAIAFVQSVGTQPFVLWLAFNAPHSPWQIPPPVGALGPVWSEPAHGFPSYAAWHAQARECLVDTPNGPQTCPGTSQNVEWYEAMASNMDVEFDRLMQALGAQSGAIPEDVLVVAIGDNGTDFRAMPDAVGGQSLPPNMVLRSKQTVYQQGVHVPLCAAGAGVAFSGDVADPVNLVDLYATLLEAGGVHEETWQAHVQQVSPGTHHDSRSLWPYLSGVRAPEPRSVMYTEIFNFAAATQSAAMTDGRYKFVLIDGPDPEECYDLDDPANFPVESANLPWRTTPACLALEAQMAQLVCTESYPDFPWANWCNSR